MTWRHRLFLSALIGITTIGFFVAGLMDFDISEYDQTELGFRVGDDTLSGTLILPEDSVNPPIAIIVHGDGPQDRFSNDGYLPLFHVLLDAGIGVFSWDKPGIGQSTGNWLDQSMPDRATEARAALQMIKAHPDVKTDSVGFLGFSQAGWVITNAANTITPAFSVLIGPAVNWQSQGAYFTRKRMQAEGATDAEITAQITANVERDTVIFTPDHIPDANDLRGMTLERFGFVGRNITADARADIAGMTGPVLAVWGADDLNVDATTDAETYRTTLPDPATQTTLIIPDATHGLLRAPLYNYQLTDQWPAYTTAVFLASGRRAFSPGALEQVTTWITAQTQ